MQKLILDTNVIVSALISSSIPSKILYELVLTEKVEICLSEEVMAEYVEVLNRDKFSKFANFKIKAEVVLNRLREIATFYQTDRKIEVLTDTSDNKFLELAAVSAADYLTTGNTLDFTITEFEYTKILTPREYWDNYAPKE
ncbi:MAG: putative toxin-antitoxin system toxin component, PIN family [Microscillaceae bacterium]|nr:putative toxin-antitoxin system toxin component, PIN family [Microscillaceae bacterium]